MTKRKKLLILQKSEFVGNELQVEFRKEEKNLLNMYYQMFENGKETVTMLFKNGQKIIVKVTGCRQYQLEQRVRKAFKGRKNNVNEV